MSLFPVLEQSKAVTQAKHSARRLLGPLFITVRPILAAARPEPVFLTEQVFSLEPKTRQGCMRMFGYEKWNSE